MLRACIRDGYGEYEGGSCRMTPTGVDLPPGPRGGTGETIATQPHLGPADLLFLGYGVVDADAGARAVRVALGADPRPVRLAEDAFHGAVLAARTAAWDRGTILDQLPPISCINKPCD
jgi:hypothetical protein